MHFLNKVRELFYDRPALLRIFALTATVVVILFVVLTVTHAPQSNYEFKEEVDLVSGEIIIIDDTNGEEIGSVMYLGFQELLRSGVTATQLDFLKQVLEVYGERNSIKLDRVSLDKDSVINYYDSDNGVYGYRFEVVTNKDQARLSVIMDISYSIDTALIRIYDENNNLVYPKSNI